MPECHDVRSIIEATAKEVEGRVGQQIHSLHDLLDLRLQAQSKATDRLEASMEGLRERDADTRARLARIEEHVAAIESSDMDTARRLAAIELSDADTAKRLGSIERCVETSGEGSMHPVARRAAGAAGAAGGNAAMIAVIYYLAKAQGWIP